MWPVPTYHTHRISDLLIVHRSLRHLTSFCYSGQTSSLEVGKQSTASHLGLCDFRSRRQVVGDTGRPAANGEDHELV